MAQMDYWKTMKVERIAAKMPGRRGGNGAFLIANMRAVEALFFAEFNTVEIGEILGISSDTAGKYVGRILAERSRETPEVLQRARRDVARARFVEMDT